MTERPILFSDPMVLAILAGTKTQTRRVIAGARGAFWDHRGYTGTVERDGVLRFREGSEGTVAQGSPEVRCPYGAVGDRLWVRETHYRYGHWEPVATKRTRTGRQKWAFVADSGEVRFERPTGARGGRHHSEPNTPAWHARLARFMPRWASRLTLEVTSVRVERVQSISEDDARAEGVEPHEYALPLKRGNSSRFVSCAEGARHRMAFARLWDSINGERPGCAWKAKPWVWVVSFKVVR